MHVLRLICLVSNTVASYTVLTPPNATPQQSERAKYGGATGDLPDALVLSGTLAKAIVYLMNAAELCVLLRPALQYVSVVLNARLAAWWTELEAELCATPALLVGSVLICTAAVLRAACYRHLGRHFTFELALRKDHKLVTSGPYAFVRHPSYTGSLMYIAGSLLIVFVDRGSSWVQLGMRIPWLARPVAAVIMAMVVLAVSLFMRRTIKEDTVLKKEFGEEWVNWSNKTQYRLLPYVF